MIYHQFVGMIIKKTQVRKDDRTVTSVTAEFPDQVNPEYQYTKEKLTFLSNSLSIGDSVRVVVLDVPVITEGEVINATEYLEPEGA